jgi:hypothetical protein
MTVYRGSLIRGIILSLSLCSPLFAQSIDEAQLFQSTESIQKVESSDLSDAAIEKESTTFTGQLFSRTLYSMARSGHWDSNSLVSYSQANIFMDTRLQRGTKVFLNIELSQLASANATLGSIATIREIFLDFNINREIYVRTGKQVLQWGRSYFWNPTDLVNTEHRDFFQLNRYRDGSYGTRVHVPIGAAQNIYVFLSQQNATNIDKIAVAAKYEFLVGNSEIGLSTWQKRNAVSLYGIDFSSRLGDLDIKGESAFSYGENTPRVRMVDDTVTLYTIRGEWTNKSSLTIQKNWDWELPERLSLTGELFFNSHGYTQSTFANSQIKAALFSNNLYIPNMNNQWYGSIFSTISKFPISEMTLGFNILSNLSDASNITGCSLAYSPLAHLTFSGSVYGYWGDPHGEYTYAGNNLSAEVSGTVEF